MKPERNSFKSLISATSKSIDRMYDTQAMSASRALRRKKLIWKYKVEMIKSDCDWAGKIIYSLSDRELEAVVERRVREASEKEKKSRRLVLIRGLLKREKSTMREKVHGFKK